MSAAGWLVANLFRWLPHRSPTGLLPIGNPYDIYPCVFIVDVRISNGLCGRQDLADGVAQAAPLTAGVA
jgi:hypothetical protein